MVEILTIIYVSKDSYVDAEEAFVIPPNEPEKSAKIEEAENCFMDSIRGIEPDISQEDLDICLENGFWESQFQGTGPKNSTQTIYLIWLDAK